MQCLIQSNKQLFQHFLNVASRLIHQFIYIYDINLHQPSCMGPQPIFSAPLIRQMLLEQSTHFYDVLSQQLQQEKYKNLKQHFIQKLNKIPQEQRQDVVFIFNVQIKADGEDVSFMHKSTPIDGNLLMCTVHQSRSTNEARNLHKWRDARL